MYKILNIWCLLWSHSKRVETRGVTHGAGVLDNAPLVKTMLMERMAAFCEGNLVLWTEGAVADAASVVPCD
jgi:hypothetical protein